MVKYALFVKERDGRWFKLTKAGREYTSKALAERRRSVLLPQTRKKIGVRKIR